MLSENEYALFMSPLSTIREIENNDRSTISLVYHTIQQSTYILRICKGRDLSGVLDALKDIKDPNAVIVYDYIYTQGNTYILEEYISGMTVKEHYDYNGAFSEKETAELIIKVCDALRSFHNHKPPIVHNDIKPSNIMIRDDGSIKVFDFDISRTYKKDAAQNTVLFGTQSFASPEHYGARQTTPRSDIYSLGVTMHYMLTGTTFSDNQNMTYKGSLKKIISKCTEFAPDNRYSSTDALKKALKSFLGKGRYILYGVLALLCVVAVLTGVILLSGGKNSPDTSTPSSIVESVTDSTQGEEISTPSEESPHSSIRKMETFASVEGDLLCMTVMNDGTFVYLEKTSQGNYQIRTSSGIENSFTHHRDLELIYNCYSNELYAVERPYAYQNISLYAVDNKSFLIDKTPLYTAEGLSQGDVSYGFFSDGVLWCSAFVNNLIDTESWSDAGNFPGIYDINIFKDTIYKTGSGSIISIASDETETNRFDMPVTTYNNPVFYTTADYMYFLGTLNGKEYIYSFDGNNYTQVACLNDYQYYTRSTISLLCVSDRYIWLYDSQSNTIEQIEI